MNAFISGKTCSVRKTMCFFFKPEFLKEKEDIHMHETRNHWKGSCWPLLFIRLISSISSQNVISLVRFQLHSPVCWTGLIIQFWQTMYASIVIESTYKFSVFNVTLINLNEIEFMLNSELLHLQYKKSLFSCYIWRVCFRILWNYNSK